jgi:hypothetical protein
VEKAPVTSPIKNNTGSAPAEVKKTVIKPSSMSIQSGQEDMKRKMNEANKKPPAPAPKKKDDNCLLF